MNLFYFIMDIKQLILRKIFLIMTIDKIFVVVAT